MTLFHIFFAKNVFHIIENFKLIAISIVYERYSIKDRELVFAVLGRSSNFRYDNVKNFTQ